MEFVLEIIGQSVLVLFMIVLIKAAVGALKG